MSLRRDILRPLIQDVMKREVTVVLTVLAIILVALNIFVKATPIGYPYNSAIYVLELLIFGACLVLEPRFGIDRILISFCVVAAASIIINRPPAYARSSEHLVLFIVLLGLLSPMVRNNLLKRFRQLLWQWTIYLLTLAIVICAILFIPYAIRYPGVIYSGIISHAMLMAIMAGISTIASIVALIAPEIILGDSKRAARYHTLRKTLAIIVLVSSVVMLLASGSRGAMLATVIAIIAICVITRRNRRICTAIAMTTLSVVTLTLLFPTTLSRPAARKTQLALHHGSITYSRDSHWKARWLEFRESPIIGIGFTNYHLNASNTESPAGNDITEPVCIDREPSCLQNADDSLPMDEIPNLAEPGSSWLSVLSNTGLLGFALIILFNLKLFSATVRSLCTQKHTETTAGSKAPYSPALLYLPLLLLFWVHGLFEGWMLYAGSLTFFLYWLLTGRIAADCQYDTNSKNQGNL